MSLDPPSLSPVSSTGDTNSARPSGAGERNTRESSIAEHDQGFASRVRSAVVWRWGTQIASQIITWTSTFLVVRLLTPADYGLFAMSQVIVTALAFLNGQSFATSIVQTDRLDQRRIGQVFGMLLISNLCLAGAQLALAPYAAAYFAEPVVADMLRVQAAIFLTIPFIAMPSEWLARHMAFRKQGQANMGAAVVGALTALALAWMGWGVWALVYAGLSIFIARGFFLMLVARFWVRPIFNPKGAWDLFTYGGTLTLCQLFWIIQSQSDVVIAGRLLETRDLGLYTQALFLTLILTARFLPPINEVALSAYSELHRANKPLGGYFLKTARMVMLVVSPIYIGLALTSQHAIPVLMGQKWTQIIPLVAGLSLVMPAFALHLICSPVTNAMGRPRVYLFTSICGALIMPVAFLWGVQVATAEEGMAMGLVHAWWVAAPLLCAITLSVTLPRVGVSPLDLARELAPIALASAAMALSVLAVQHYAPIGIALLDLAWNAAVGATVYALSFWLVWPHIVKDAWRLLRPGAEPQPAAPLR